MSSFIRFYPPHLWSLDTEQPILCCHLSGRVVLACTAWQETSRRLKDTVIRSFLKCGIAMPISGSRDSEINIDGLPDYRMGELAHVEEIEFFSHSEEESETQCF